MIKLDKKKKKRGVFYCSSIMTIETIKLKDAPEYKNFIKNKALRSAEQIIAKHIAILPENENISAPITANLSLITPAASNGAPHFITAENISGEQITHQHVSQNFQELISAHPEAFSEACRERSSFLLRTEMTDLIFATGYIDDIFSSHYDSLRGILYFNRNDHTLNIYDGEHWHFINMQRRDQ